MSANNDPRYWILVCNPKVWAIDRFFQEVISQGVTQDIWKIRQSDCAKFGPGDKALIRVGLDQRNKKELDGNPKLDAGIYALCEVQSNAVPCTWNPPSEAFWAPGKTPTSGMLVVEIDYKKVFNNPPLTIKRLKEELPGVSKPVLNGLQASSFPISKADFEAIEGLLNKTPQKAAKSSSLNL